MGNPTCPLLTGEAETLRCREGQGSLNVMPQRSAWVFPGETGFDPDNHVNPQQLLRSLIPYTLLPPQALRYEMPPKPEATRPLFAGVNWGIQWG